MRPTDRDSISLRKFDLLWSRKKRKKKGKKKLQVIGKAAIYPSNYSKSIDRIVRKEMLDLGVAELIYNYNISLQNFFFLKSFHWGKDQIILHHYFFFLYL